MGDPPYFFPGSRRVAGPARVCGECCACDSSRRNIGPGSRTHLQHLRGALPVRTGVAIEDCKTDELAWEVRRTAERTDAKAFVATRQCGSACGRQLRAHPNGAGLRGAG